jgi:hypothetical protein
MSITSVRRMPGSRFFEGDVVRVIPFGAVATLKPLYVTA